MIREYTAQLKTAQQVLPTQSLQSRADRSTLFELYFAEEVLGLFEDKFSSMQMTFEDYKRVVLSEMSTLVKQRIDRLCRFLIDTDGGPSTQPQHQPVQQTAAAPKYNNSPPVNQGWPPMSGQDQIANPSKSPSAGTAHVNILPNLSHGGLSPEFEQMDLTIRQLKSDLTREVLQTSELRRQITNLEDQVRNKDIKASETQTGVDGSSWQISDRPRMPIKTLEQALDISESDPNIQRLERQLADAIREKQDLQGQTELLKDKISSLQAYIDSITKGPNHPAVQGLISKQGNMDSDELVKECSITILKLQAENRYLRIALETEKETRNSMSLELNSLRAAEQQSRLELYKLQEIVALNSNRPRAEGTVVTVGGEGRRYEKSEQGRVSEEAERWPVEGRGEKSGNGERWSWDPFSEQGRTSGGREGEQQRPRYLTRRILEARAGPRPSLAFGTGTLGEGMRMSDTESSHVGPEPLVRAVEEQEWDLNQSSVLSRGETALPKLRDRHPMKESFRSTYLRSVSKSPLKTTKGETVVLSGKPAVSQIAKTETFLADFNRRIEAISGHSN